MITQLMTSQIPHTLLKRASTLIEERTGIAVYTQLRGTFAELLVELAEGDIARYLDRLEESAETAPIWQTLINALTIGETYFLRDRSHFHLLRTHIFPEIIRKRRDQGSRHINVWSVGCATGEEPYSLAITLYELLPDIEDWTIRLIGTDLNPHALHIARRGIYRKWAFRHTDLDFQGVYFDPTPRGLQIKSHIRQLVTFRHANLLDGPPLPQLDLILCRNVLLYFSTGRTLQAETMFYNALVPGGWLFLGQAEVLHHQREQWVTHIFPGSPVYQKPNAPLDIPPGEFAYKHHTTMTAQIVGPNGKSELATYDDAVLALQEEIYDEAESILSGLLAHHPDHAAAHTLLAYILANRNHLPKAQAEIDAALELDPLLADAHYLQAVLFMEEGRAEKAYKALRAALYCQRNHPLASFMLGNLHAQAGELIKATRFWENTHTAIARLTPDSPISDISQITAGQLELLVKEQLHSWAD